MQLYFTNPHVNTCEIHNGKQTISFHLGIITRTKYNKIEEPFRELNAFLERLTGEQRERLWYCYLKFHDAVNMLKNPMHINQSQVGLVTPVNFTEVMKQITTEFYSYLSYEEIHHWVIYWSGIGVPEDTPKVKDPYDPNPEMTYLDSDYRGLITLTIILRMMMPVWCEYMLITTNAQGSEDKLFKEYNAYQLLAYSWVDHCEPVERLRRYIHANQNKPRMGKAEKVDLSPVILSYMSSTKFPEWLLCRVVVGRLAIGSIELGTLGSIISNVHSVVDTTMKGVHELFGNVQSIKPTYGDGTTREDRSIHEEWKSTQSVTIGEKVIINGFALYPRHVIKYFNPSPTMELVNELFNHLGDHSPNPIDVQITLLKMLYHNSIPEIAVDYLDSDRYKILSCIASAALITWGYADIAGILMGDAVIPSNESLRIVPVEGTIDIDTLQSIYSGYSQITTTALNGKPNCPVVDEIYKMVEELIHHNWTYRLPEYYRKSGMVNMMPGTSYIATPLKLADRLAKLIVKLEI